MNYFTKDSDLFDNNLEDDNDTDVNDTDDTDIDDVSDDLTEEEPKSTLTDSVLIDTAQDDDNVSENLDYSLQELPDDSSFKTPLDTDLTQNWFSLIHFPDETRVRLTKRGRLFVFQTSDQKAISILNLIGRATWNRYKTNLDMTIPLGIIRSLFDEEKDLFVSSFTVTTIGSQKVQLSVKLPIKVSNSPLPKLLALLCLTRHVFNTGIFQTDNIDKAESFITLFSTIFSIELQKGENKRGFYIKIPLPIVKAIATFYTGNEQASVTEIIQSLEKNRSERESIDFLNTWFAFSRIYRNLRHTDKILFMFRANTITDEIVKLLTKLEIQWENGSIQEADTIIPVYIVKNVAENKAILNLSFIEDDSNPKQLLEHITSLATQIQAKDEKINMLTNLINEYRDKLEFEKSNRMQAVYSRYYYEKKTEELREKFIELQRVKEELEKENQELQKLVIEHHFISGKESQISAKKEALEKTAASDVADVDSQAFQKVLDKYAGTPEFDQSAVYHNIRTRELEIRMKEKENDYLVTHGEDDVSETFGRSNLSNPEITKQLLYHMGILMDRSENWIVFGLTIMPLTLEQMEQVSGMERLEVRKLLTRWEEEGFIERVKKDMGEPTYQFGKLWTRDRIKNLKDRIMGRKISADVRSKLREILQI